MTLAQQKAVQVIRDNRLAPQEFLADAIADAFEAFGDPSEQDKTETKTEENS